MKIKSVKIIGFRAFEKENDSTFDFTKNGEIMNFASIYAPNGYGKTSFYDAVEWGVTHKIQRFDRMVDFEKVRKENNGPLLLNNSSNSGKVIIETSKGVFEQAINPRKKYDFRAKAVNDYFKDQILTQDLIDAFLKEDKADKRYDNFLEIDENLKKYDLVYKKINTLLVYINDQKKELTKNKEDEEKKLQGEFDFDLEFKKFDEINDEIKFLNTAGEDLIFIDKHKFNQTAYENLSRNVDVRLSSIREELIKAKYRIETITLARDGEESEDGILDGGLLSYLDNKSKIQKYDEQLQQLEQIIKWFEEQDIIINESRLNDENLKNQQNRLKRALNIEKQFEIFLSVQKEIEILQKDISDYKETLLNIEKEELEIVKEKNDATIKLADLKNNFDFSQSKLNKLPAQQELLELTSKKISNLKQTNDTLTKSISTEEKKLSDLKLVLDELEFYENKINDDIELLLEFKLFDQHKKLVAHYVAEEKKLQKLKMKIQEIHFKIDNQKQFNSELKNFINSGLELVNKSQSSDCPLCNQRYNSFEKLSENILSNKLLDSQLKIYLEEKIEAESELKKLMVNLSDDKAKIEKNFSLIKLPYLLDQRIVKKAIDKLDSERTVNSEKINSSQSLLNEIILSLGNFNTFEELSTKIKNDLSKFEDQILKLTDIIKKYDETLLQKEIIEKSTKEKLKITEPNLLKYQSSNEYTTIRAYFIQELNTNEIEKNILSEVIINIQESINDLIGKKEWAIKSLDEFKTKLSKYTLSKDEYVKITQQVKDAKNIILRAYDSYENHIKSEFNVIISGKSKSQIEKEFLDLIEKQKELERRAESKIEKYNIVKILNDACIKATESKKVKDSILEIIKTLQELKRSEKILIIEKDNLKTYLKSTIESYFYTPLINAIYKKMDPHPDYKSIEFECDFAENKPRLQIYTLSKNDEGKEVRTVPSLYFSTAQVNILSLSIFLARALKTKDHQKEPVDCIFIDDPIQSMDSINILSFIDLFRGITLSLDKQLIVSKHEENFHLLLQKKIPSELFKSKFIEFETFGKLKN